MGLNTYFSNVEFNGEISFFFCFLSFFICRAIVMEKIYIFTLFPK